MTSLASVHLEDCSGNLVHLDTPELPFLGQDKHATESISDHHPSINKTRARPPFPSPPPFKSIVSARRSLSF
ncbi:hypothetical protein V1478_003260 [Vespula squamosa]|uniref:Uncharacterized protein n=1 Tax=Vespula squamosa TaxID=30214 RepID=A0ABD2BS74_VESSQ